MIARGAENAAVVVSFCSSNETELIEIARTRLGSRARDRGGRTGNAIVIAICKRCNAPGQTPALWAREISEFHPDTGCCLGGYLVRAAGLAVPQMPRLCSRL